MAYTIELIKKEDQKTSCWSGGTTTQLAIYPPSSEYGKLNFKWRLSSAKVEVEESTFTNLPGIWRHIMVIEGKLKLNHEGHHNISLNPFEKDSFSGDWTTKSYGKVTDFNLMLNKDCSGDIYPIMLNKNLSFTINSDSSTTEALYCVQGPIEIITNKDDKIALNAGDLLLINKEKEDLEIELNSKNEDSIVIRVCINY
ncbi:HutD family protein [Clostridium sp. MSJ-11]|uniref:HutD family protein n=1 Tax=Clostridium mobile TaxID=2841512 RepID=A0ABS6EEH7_9CLOT|nr:HutD family protein [Clostridium mobile]MBU5483187.1 HutD family protein [Clostridium mobile]